MLDLNSEVLIHFQLHQAKKGEVPHLTLVRNPMLINLRRFEKPLVARCDIFGYFTSNIMYKDSKVALVCWPWQPPARITVTICDSRLKMYA